MVSDEPTTSNTQPVTLEWMTDTDGQILQHLKETGQTQTASAIELNLDDDSVRYGDIVRRLSVLEAHDLVENDQWGYYSLTPAGETLLTGFADPDDGTESESTDDATPEVDITVYEDAADRLERMLDIQHEIINEVDTKAAHITRLLGIFLGVVVSALSLTHQIEGINLADATRPVLVSFLLGLTGLLLSMIGASITYLSSRFKIGLSYNVGKWLSNEETSTTTKTHLRRTVGTYGYNIDQNEDVIKSNFSRFKFTILLMLVGVLYFVGAGVLFAFQMEEQTGKYLIGGITLFSGILAWYVLSGKHLTLDDEEWIG